MSRPTRDPWLSTARGRQAVKKDAIDKVGLLDPASDHVFRALGTGTSPHITNWGGSKGENGLVAVMKRDVPPELESRQLRDPFMTFYTQGMALEPPLPPERLLALSEENPLHGSCLMAKAIDACGRGWAFEPQEGLEGDPALLGSTQPDVLRAAVDDLTPDFTFSELLYQAAWEMDAIGWSVWEVVRDVSAGAVPHVYAGIGAIYPIPAHTVRATLDPRKWVQIRAGRIRYFKKFGAKCDINCETGEIFDWKDATAAKSLANLDPMYVASEVIIFKYYTPRSLWYGIPRWVSSVPTIAEMTAIREFNLSWFASGGQTDFSMHMMADDLDTAKAMLDQVKTQMEENRGRGHTFVLTAGTKDTDVKVAKLGELLREGHFRFRRGDLAKEILIAHNVPPYRIGWAETGSLGGNAAPEMLAAYKFGAIEPIQLVIEERLAQTLFDPETGIKTDQFRLKLHEMDLDEVSAELQIATAATEGGWMTGNQAREKIGEEKDETAPSLNQYFYHGQPIGVVPGALPGMPGGPVAQNPGDGQPFGNAVAGGAAPAGPAAPAAPGAGVPFGGGAKPAAAPGAGVPFGNAAPRRAKPSPAFGPLSAEMKSIVRSAIAEALGGLESTLKSALEDDDEPPRKRKTGRRAPHSTDM